MFALLPPESKGRWHYEHNKLRSYLPPGETSSHLDTGGLLTLMSVREESGSWKVASGGQLWPVWQRSPRWVTEEDHRWLTYAELGVQSKQTAADVANPTPAVCSGSPSGQRMFNEDVWTRNPAAHPGGLGGSGLQRGTGRVPPLMLSFVCTKLNLPLLNVEVGFAVFFICRPAYSAGTWSSLKCNISFKLFASNFVPFRKNIHTARHPMASCLIGILPQHTAK